MTDFSLISLLKRALLLTGLAVILTACGWFVIRTAMGDRLMAVARGNNEYDTATKLLSADAAVQFAPQVAALHYQRGQTYLALALGEEAEARLQTAIAALRQAVQIGPEDYRIWVALGQALDRHGETEAAKQAFAQALTRAPNYYEPHWALANHLLRNNETESAFAEFKRALAIRPSELPLLFDYAWNAFNGDVPSILKALTPSAHAQTQFAAFLIQRDKFAEGMTLWQELGKANPALARANTQSFIQVLLAQQHFGAAYEIWGAAAKTKHPDEEKWPEEFRLSQAQWFEVNQPDAGSLLNNGDFERDLKIGATAPFTIWRLTATKGLSVSRNNQQRKSGEHSLQLNFDMGGNIPFPIIEQLIPLQPATTYHLSFAAKIEDLTTLSAPLVEVYDPANLQQLRAMTKPFALGTSAWQEHTIDFTTTAKTEAAMVRVLRPACGEPPCPIRGKIWLDDFKLTPSK
jgi:tetratricopeptide (TPR) repeat protein